MPRASPACLPAMDGCDSTQGCKPPQKLSIWSRINGMREKWSSQGSCGLLRLFDEIPGHCEPFFYPRMEPTSTSGKPLSASWRTLPQSDRVCRTDFAQFCWGCQGPQPACRETPDRRIGQTSVSRTEVLMGQTTRRPLTRCDIKTRYMSAPTRAETRRLCSCRAPALSSLRNSPPHAACPVVFRVR